MYSWYWPKDEPSAVLALLGVGHRHDWECVVLWLSEESLDATVVGASASAHGKFSTSTSPDFSSDGLLVEYWSNGILDHSLELTDTVGDQQPLVAWESLDTTIQDALANTDWGAANVPFIDSHFETNLEKAEL